MCIMPKSHPEEPMMMTMMVIIMIVLILILDRSSNVSDHHVRRGGKRPVFARISLPRDRATSIHPRRPQPSYLSGGGYVSWGPGESPL